MRAPRLAVLVAAALVALPAAVEAATLQLVMVGTNDASCKHEGIEEAVVRSFLPEPTSAHVKTTFLTLGHDTNCDSLDLSGLSGHITKATGIAKANPTVVYFGFAVYGRVKTWDKQLAELAKYAVIVTGSGNIGNDSCQTMLAPFAVQAGSAENGQIASYSGKGACADLYLDYGGSITVPYQGTNWGVGGTSTAGALTAAEALILWNQHPQTTNTEIQQALSLSQRIVTTAELTAAPTLEVLPLHAARGSVSVLGRVQGPVSQISVYRGLPSAGVCRGKALATAAAGRDGRFSLTVPARGANLCVAPKPFGQAVGVSIE